jgi:hypothetical protein
VAWLGRWGGPTLPVLVADFSDELTRRALQAPRCLGKDRVVAIAAVVQRRAMVPRAQRCEQRSDPCALLGGGLTRSHERETGWSTAPGLHRTSDARGRRARSAARCLFVRAARHGPDPGPHVPAASRLPQSTAFWAARWSSHGSRRVAEVSVTSTCSAPRRRVAVSAGRRPAGSPRGAIEEIREEVVEQATITRAWRGAARLGTADLAKSLRLRLTPGRTLRIEATAGRIAPRSDITVDVGSPLLRAPLGRSPAPRAAKRSGSLRRRERSPQIAGIRYSSPRGRRTPCGARSATIAVERLPAPSCRRSAHLGSAANRPGRRKREPHYAGLRHPRPNRSGTGSRTKATASVVLVIAGLMGS